MSGIMTFKQFVTTFNFFLAKFSSMPQHAQQINRVTYIIKNKEYKEIDSPTIFKVCI